MCLSVSLCDALQEEVKKQRAAQEAANQETMRVESNKKQAEWSAKLAEVCISHVTTIVYSLDSQVRRQEQEALELAASPLRSYLMKHVMPTLTQGLLEVCKSRPDDAVDVLAEYLFKNNPQIQ